MGTAQDIQQVELSIEEARGHIQKMNALYRLSQNKDYELIFLNGFFKDYAISQVMLKADPTQQSDQDQRTVIENIHSIGSLRMHLHAIISQGRAAESALKEHQETHEELLMEGDE